MKIIKAGAKSMQNRSCAAVNYHEIKKVQYCHCVLLLQLLILLPKFGNVIFCVMWAYIVIYTTRHGKQGLYVMWAYIVIYLLHTLLTSHLKQVFSQLTSNAQK